MNVDSAHGHLHLKIAVTKSWNEILGPRGLRAVRLNDSLKLLTASLNNKSYLGFPNALLWTCPSEPRSPLLIENLWFLVCLGVPVNTEVAQGLEGVLPRSV